MNVFDPVLMPLTQGRIVDPNADRKQGSFTMYLMAPSNIVVQGQTKVGNKVPMQRYTVAGRLVGQWAVRGRWEVRGRYQDRMAEEHWGSQLRGRETKQAEIKTVKTEKTRNWNN